jgi:hypothetical protein
MDGQWPSRFGSVARDTVGLDSPVATFSMTVFPKVDNTIPREWNDFAVRHRDRTDWLGWRGSRGYDRSVASGREASRALGPDVIGCSAGGVYQSLSDPFRFKGYAAGLRSSHPVDPPFQGGVCLPLCCPAPLSTCGNHSGDAERSSGIGLRLFGFIAELAFAFIPERRSESSGMSYTLPRNPQAVLSGTDRGDGTHDDLFRNLFNILRDAVKMRCKLFAVSWIFSYLRSGNYFVISKKRPKPSTRERTVVPTFGV